MSDLKRSTKVNMEDWPRRYFQASEGRPFLFYVLYGSFEVKKPMSKSTYWSNGIPRGFKIMHYSRDNQAEVLDDFLVGHASEDFKHKNNKVSEGIEESPECYILRGEIADSSDLNYLRDAIGLLTYLADHGGVGIHDPQMFRWWTIDSWKKEIFEHHQSYPRHHTIILFSEEENGAWFHTRGMRKFGRPDLSLRGVADGQREKVIELFNRFIEYHAFGGIIEDGKEIRIEGFPSGYRCYQQGHLDDSDFNNVHVEIRKVDQGSDSTG
ncbi:MAG: hypothetical protein SFY80_07570 [Verrucomicrobiota bacterium]|nr:hypothetical protein [Verrucomicrobiota bacterium]